MNVRTGFVTGPRMDPLRAVDCAADADLSFVEFLLDGDAAHRRLTERRASLRSAVDEHGLDVLVHLPFTGVPIGSPHDRVREGAMAETEAALEFAGSLDAERAVLHATDGVFWSSDRTELQRCIDPVEHLVDVAADHGVECCVENLADGVGTAEVPALLEATDASLTLDTGHARVDGLSDDELAAFAARHADRIAHVHLNDTRRPKDEHLPFGSGTVDFAEVFRALGDDWTGTLSLEVFTDDFETVEWSARRLHALLADL